MKQKGIIWLLVGIISVPNCLYKTFRSDKVVQWDAREKFDKRLEVSISDESLTDTRHGPFDNFDYIWPISNETKKIYQTIINKVLIESNLISLSGDTLKIDMNHTIERNSISVSNIIFSFLTLTLYPITLDEKHKIKIKITNHDLIIFEKQSEELVQFRFSYWFVVLLNFFNSADIRDRIFYEHSSLLLKDFYKVYSPYKAKK